MPKKTLSLSGEVHISDSGIYTTVDALEAMKAVGIAYGLHHHAEEERGRRVMLYEGGERPALVIEADTSYHGSPTWDQVCILTDDPKQIARYLAFQDALKIVKEMELEPEKITSQRDPSPPPQGRDSKKERKPRYER